MPAPDYAYKNNKTQTISIKNSNDVINSAAAAINIYGVNSDAVKGIFYLDDFISYKASDDSIAWVGVIYDNPNSLNYQMHNPAKFSPIKLKDGTRLIALLDAGLNTRGMAFSDGNFIVFWANLFIVDFHVRSSYYDSTISFGFEFRKQNVGIWYSKTISTGFPAANEQADGYGSIELPENTFAKGDVIEVRPWISNPEGTYFGVPKIVIADDNVVKKLTHNKGSLSCDTSPIYDAIYVYFKSEDFQWLQSFTSTGNANSGRFMYKDFTSSGALEVADVGWYDNLIANFANRMVYIGAGGEIQKIVDCGTNTTVYLSFERQTVLVNGTYRTYGHVKITLPYSFTTPLTFFGDVKNSGTTGADHPFSIEVPAGNVTWTDNFNTVEVVGGDKLSFNSVSVSPTYADGVYISVVPNNEP